MLFAPSTETCNPWPPLLRQSKMKSAVFVPPVTHRPGPTHPQRCGSTCGRRRDRCQIDRKRGGEGPPPPFALRRDRRRPGSSRSLCPSNTGAPGSARSLSLVSSPRFRLPTVRSDRFHRTISSCWRVCGTRPRPSVSTSAWRLARTASGGYAGEKVTTATLIAVEIVRAVGEDALDEREDAP
jgi:hypothetical protein